MFAEKIRALNERTRPRDLYDVINFFRRPESQTLAGAVRTILLKKCEYKNVGFPQLGELNEHKETCESGWREQLAHQLQALPPFASFWDELPAFFAWLERPEQATSATLPIPASGEIYGLSPWHIGSTTPQLGILDRIRFAAVNRLCVELDYRKENGQRQTYLIEPYSLRTTAENNLLLYGVKLPTAEIRGFRTDRILDAKVIERAFTPRYAVDFIPDGPVTEALIPGHTLSVRRAF